MEIIKLKESKDKITLDLKELQADNSNLKLELKEVVLLFLGLSSSMFSLFFTSSMFSIFFTS
jgi:hypothetical protein